MVTRRTPSWAWPAWAGPLLVVVLFCAPLFVGLDSRDLHNDEAIYSYAVDKMVETGVWGTPQSIPTTEPFLEKPPLKFWIVSAAIRAGLLPKNEVGFRFFDALFGSIAFLYIYALGWRLVAQSAPDDPARPADAAAAPARAQALQALAGVVAVLTFFTIERVLFDHGLRSNNMEGPLILAYCGGIYHLARWRDATTLRARRGHALAVGAYFTLGFMVKFVAALFMPVLGLLAVLWQRHAWRELRAKWTDWLLPALLVIAVSAPWFVYSTMVHGRYFWDVILGAHVVARFTASLDPSHLHPWHYYFTKTWFELARVGTAWLVLAGLALLAVRAWQGRPWLARLLFLWWLVPFLLMSIGSSKLFHYAYPFLPPLAIGTGWLVVQLVHFVGWLLQRMPGGLFADRVASAAGASAGRVALRRVLAGVGVLALVIAGVTLVLGSWHVNIGSMLLFRNSSVARPLILGMVLTWISGYARTSAFALPALALSAALPGPTYVSQVQQMTHVVHPLRTVRDCTARIQSSGLATGRGVYNAAYAQAYHSYNYYFARLGPWPVAEHPDPAELRRRLFEPAHQTPILLSSEDFSQALTLTVPEGLPNAGASVGATIDAVSADFGLVIVLPGPYGVCAAPAVAAGGQSVAKATGGTQP